MSNTGQALLNHGQRGLNKLFKYCCIRNEKQMAEYIERFLPITKCEVSGSVADFTCSMQFGEEVVRYNIKTKPAVSSGFVVTEIAEIN